VNAVFLDTVKILALLESSDQRRRVAVDVWAMLEKDCRSLRTTTLVLMECANAAARKPYRSRIVEMRNEFRADGTLVEPTDSEIEMAWDAYGRGRAGMAGIVDHISFAVMRRLGLSQALTSDAHFRAAGFETVLKI
jgi:predicted nucleic acid-binding protein